jgi:hypothetical protein
MHMHDARLALGCVVVTLLVVRLLASCDAATPAAPLAAPAAPPPSASSVPARAPAPLASVPPAAAAAETSVDAGIAPDPAEPRGSRLTNAVTTSSGTVADADRAILAVRPKLRRCYEGFRGKGADIEGMVTCGVRITKAGKVGAVGLVRREYLPNPLVDCLLRELATAVFEPREAEAVIMVPVRFGP